MAQEEHDLPCTYTGGAGGRGGAGVSCSSSSKPKKMKQKKVPQRGLGVAQLEKIRIEEQHKKESLQAANILAKTAVGSSAADASSFLAVRPPFHNSSSVPLPPPGLNRQSLPPNLEIMQVHVSKQSNAGELDSQPRLWGGEINLARERLIRLDHRGFAFDPQSYQDTVLPYPAVVPQRSHQFHHTPPPPPPPSMLQVNNSTSGILPPSVVVNPQMEPPSNQSFRGNNYPTLWTDEDEVVGMKRSYPYCLDSPSAPSSHRTFQPIYAASSSSKLDELALCNNDRLESRNKSIRLDPSNSSPLPETVPNEVNINDGKMHADFLTLAPPSIASPPSITRHMHPFGYSGHEYEGRTSQEHTKSADKTFSFFPTELQSNGSTANESTGNWENGEKIDLNLKL